MSLPPSRSIGDSGHVSDHNAIVAELAQTVRTVNGVGPDSSGNVTVDGGSGGSVTSGDITDATTVGKALLTAADAAAARTAIGAGTSSFSGAYADLSGKPTLGTAAATAATDYATAAQGAKADAAIPSGLVDAKGDLIVGTADDTVTRLPAGTNGHVLTADSGEASGVKWAAPSAGQALAPLRPGGWHLGGWSPIGTRASFAVSADVLYVWPWLVDREVDIDRVRFHVSTASTSGTCRIGIATMDDALSGTTIHDLGEMSTQSTGTKEFGSLSLTFSAGFYWIMLLASEPCTLNNGMSGAFVAGPTFVLGGPSIHFANPACISRYVNQTYGPLPSGFSTLLEGTNDSFAKNVLPIFMGVAS